jgi:hypothetical protein
MIVVVVVCALLMIVVVVVCALLIATCITDSNVHCDSNTVACRKHKGVVGWLCTKLEGYVG